MMLARRVHCLYEHPKPQQIDEGQDVNSNQTLSVYISSDFRASEGVAQGDSIGVADDLILDDVYQLAELAPKRSLDLADQQDGQFFEISTTSENGRAGNIVAIDSCATFMGADGKTQEVLILVEVEDGGIEEVYLLPLSELMPKGNYRLVGVDRHTATRRFAEIACVSFTKGTHITLASGEQRLIEDLCVGDKVLTRDDGPQAVRWLGHNTVRATSNIAPVVIKKGALNNTNDLIVSPDHRLFIYQRQDKIGTGRSEVMVKARHLINDDTVFQQPGGYVDYYQLLFDEHQIVYAEGIAAETMLVDPRTKTALPSSIETEQPLHAHREHMDYEVQESLLSQRDAIQLLKEASSS